MKARILWMTFGMAVSMLPVEAQVKTAGAAVAKTASSTGRAVKGAAGGAAKAVAKTTTTVAKTGSNTATKTAKVAEATQAKARTVAESARAQRAKAELHQREQSRLKAEAEKRKVDAVAKISRAARREAMRHQGIPTSQQPTKQTYHKDSDGVARRSYSYSVPKERTALEKGGKYKSMTVINDPAPKAASAHHGPHWEAGKTKTPDPLTNKPRLDQYKRERLENGKSRVGYPNSITEKKAEMKEASHQAQQQQQIIRERQTRERRTTGR